MKAHTVLHVSHTNINKDPRILRELEAVATLQDIRVVGIGQGCKSTDGVSCNLPFTVHTISPTRLARFLPGPIALAASLIKLYFVSFFKGLRLRPAVVHCHDTPALPVGALLRIATGCRVIYDAHELESKKQTNSIIYPKATLIIEKACWRYVNHLITVSDGICDWYQCNLAPKPSSIVMNAPVVDVDAPIDKGNESYYREKFGIPVSATIFLFLGNLCNGRCIEAILDAFMEDQSGSHVVFMGDGPLKSHILQAVESCSRVHLHDPVPHKRVVQVASSADIGICLIEPSCLSYRHCLPNKLFEYAFADLPVLASKLPDIERVVGRHKLGRCCDQTKDDLAGEIADIARQKPIFEGVDLYDLSWDRQAITLQDLYRTLID